MSLLAAAVLASAPHVAAQEPSVAAEAADSRWTHVGPAPPAEQAPLREIVDAVSVERIERDIRAMIGNIQGQNGVVDNTVARVFSEGIRADETERVARIRYRVY